MLSIIRVYNANDVCPPPPPRSKQDEHFGGYLWSEMFLCIYLFLCHILFYFIIIFLIFLNFLFIYLWLCWVSASV